MTAYEHFVQQAQNASFASTVFDTHTMSWATDSDDLPSHQQTTSSGSVQGNYELTSHPQQSHGYTEAQYQIYTNDGWFDYSKYQYPDVSTMREEEPCNQQSYPVWETTSSWVPQPQSHTAPSGPFGQLTPRVESHVQGNYIPPWTNHASPAQPMVTPNHLLYSKAAHQPVPPSKQSSYSELTVHLQFMERLEREAAAAACRRQSLPAISTTTSTGATGATSDHEIPPSSARDDLKPTIIPTSIPNFRVIADSTARNVRAATSARTSMGDAPSPSARSSSSSNRSAKNTPEPKKPSLACTFCRERKIACGRPPDGSPDLTCNQCARRSFVCTYIVEPPRIPKRIRKPRTGRN